MMTNVTSRCTDQELQLFKDVGEDNKNISVERGPTASAAFQFWQFARSSLLLPLLLLTQIWVLIVHSKKDRMHMRVNHNYSLMARGGQGYLEPDVELQPSCKRAARELGFIKCYDKRAQKLYWFHPHSHVVSHLDPGSLMHKVFGCCKRQSDSIQRYRNARTGTTKGSTDDIVEPAENEVTEVSENPLPSRPGRIIAGGSPQTVDALFEALDTTNMDGVSYEQVEIFWSKYVEACQPMTSWAEVAEIFRILDDQSQKALDRQQFYIFVVEAFVRSRWVAAVDESSGNVYYIDQVSQATTWTEPDPDSWVAEHTADWPTQYQSADLIADMLTDSIDVHQDLSGPTSDPGRAPPRRAQPSASEMIIVEQTPSDIIFEQIDLGGSGRIAFPGFEM